MTLIRDIHIQQLMMAAAAGALESHAPVIVGVSMDATYQGYPKDVMFLDGSLNYIYDDHTQYYNMSFAEGDWGNSVKNVAPLIFYDGAILESSGTFTYEINRYDNYDREAFYGYDSLSVKDSINPDSNLPGITNSWPLLGKMCTPHTASNDIYFVVIDGTAPNYVTKFFKTDKAFSYFQEAANSIPTMYDSYSQYWVAPRHTDIACTTEYVFCSSLSNISPRTIYIDAYTTANFGTSSIGRIEVDVSHMTYESQSPRRMVFDPITMTLCIIEEGWIQETLQHIHRYWILSITIDDFIANRSFTTEETTEVAQSWDTHVETGSWFDFQAYNVAAYDGLLYICQGSSTWYGNLPGPIGLGIYDIFTGRLKKVKGNNMGDGSPTTPYSGLYIGAISVTPIEYNIPAQIGLADSQGRYDMDAFFFDNDFNLLNDTLDQFWADRFWDTPEYGDSEMYFAPLLFNNGDLIRISGDPAWSIQKYNTAITHDAGYSAPNLPNYTVIEEFGNYGDGLPPEFPNYMYFGRIVTPNTGSDDIYIEMINGSRPNYTSSFYQTNRNFDYFKIANFSHSFKHPYYTQYAMGMGMEIAVNDDFIFCLTELNPASYGLSGYVRIDMYRPEHFGTSDYEGFIEWNYGLYTSNGFTIDGFEYITTRMSFDPISMTLSFCGTGEDFTPEAWWYTHNIWTLPITIEDFRSERVFNFEDATFVGALPYPVTDPPFDRHNWFDYYGGAGFTAYGGRLYVLQFDEYDDNRPTELAGFACYDLFTLETIFLNGTTDYTRELWDGYKNGGIGVTKVIEGIEPPRIVPESERVFRKRYGEFVYILCTKRTRIAGIWTYPRYIRKFRRDDLTFVSETLMDSVAETISPYWAVAIGHGYVYGPIDGNNIEIIQVELSTGIGVNLGKPFNSLTIPNSAVKIIDESPDTFLIVGVSTTTPRQLYFERRNKVDGSVNSFNQIRTYNYNYYNAPGVHFWGPDNKLYFGEGGTYPLGGVLETPLRESYRMKDSLSPNWGLATSQQEITAVTDYDSGEVTIYGCYTNNLRIQKVDYSLPTGNLTVPTPEEEWVDMNDTVYSSTGVFSGPWSPKTVTDGENIFLHTMNPADDTTEIMAIDPVTYAPVYWATPYLDYTDSNNYTTVDQGAIAIEWRTQQEEAFWIGGGAGSNGYKYSIWQNENSNTSINWDSNTVGWYLRLEGDGIDSWGNSYWEIDGYRYTKGIQTTTWEEFGQSRNHFAMCRTTVGFEPDTNCPATYRTLYTYGPGSDPANFSPTIQFKGSQGTVSDWFIISNVGWNYSTWNDIRYINEIYLFENYEYAIKGTTTLRIHEDNVDGTVVAELEDWFTVGAHDYYCSDAWGGIAISRWGYSGTRYLTSGTVLTHHYDFNTTAMTMVCVATVYDGDPTVSDWGLFTPLASFVDAGGYHSHVYYAVKHQSNMTDYFITFANPVYASSMTNVFRHANKPIVVGPVTDLTALPNPPAVNTFDQGGYVLVYGGQYGELTNLSNPSGYTSTTVSWGETYILNGGVARMAYKTISPPAGTDDPGTYFGTAGTPTTAWTIYLYSGLSP